MKFFSFLRKRWIDVLVIFILVIATSLSFVFVYSPKEKKNMNADILLENEILCNIDLSKGEEKEIEIEGLYTKMVIAYKLNSICVKESGCPSKFCVKTGWISEEGRSIICLHNHVVVRINGEASSDVII